MPETTCTMCFGTGQIIRIFDGRKIRCPDCTGYGHVNKPPRKPEPHVRRPHRQKPERPPAEILERQRQQAQNQSAQPSEDYQPTPSTTPRTTKKRRTKRKRSKLSAKLRRYRAILTLTGVIALIIALKVIQHSV